MRYLIDFAHFVRESVSVTLYVLALLWRCIYPFLASVFLVVFFCVATQGTELLKIFIAGERKVYQHWSLAPGFALACSTIWWVSRKILLTPWQSVHQREPTQEVHPWAVFWIPALLALTPMLLVTHEAYYIETTSQKISASACHWADGAECASGVDQTRPRQVFLFLLFHTLLLAIIVVTAKVSSTRRELSRLSGSRIWIAACLLFAVAIWLAIVWSGPSAGSIGEANFARHQMMIQRSVGSVSIVLLAVISWTILGGFLLTMFPKRILGYTLVALPLVLAVVSSSFRYRDNAVRTLAAPENTKAASTIGQSLEAFHARFDDAYAKQSADKQIPIYLVAASGGGLRAAYWSASVLADLQDAHPQFADHLFLISGVSGGGLGAATFIAGLRPDSCPNAISFTLDDSMGDCVRRILEDVSLAPVLSATLYPDFWRSLWPTQLQDMAWRGLGLKAIFGAQIDRARVLEHSWETSFAFCSQRPQIADAPHVGQSLARPFRCAERKWEHATPISVVRADTMGLSIQKVWEDLPPYHRPHVLPNLIINGTDVATGKRILSSNLNLNPWEFPDAYIARTDDPKLLPISLSTMVHNGARFPVVSPAGRIANYDGRTVLAPSGRALPSKGDVPKSMSARGISEQAQLMCNQPTVYLNDDTREQTIELNPCKVGSQRVHRIVDGGYFDNSGLITVLDVLDEIADFNVEVAKRGKRRLRPTLIIIANNGWSYANPTASQVSAFGSIFGTYTRAPDARAARDLAELADRRVLGAAHDTFVFNLDRSGSDVPGLGWALSESSTNQMIIASAQTNYHLRVEGTLERIASFPIEQSLLNLGEAKTRRQTRCIFAIARTSLALELNKLCPSE
jgi:hypothetical protein